MALVSRFAHFIFKWGHHGSPLQATAIGGFLRKLCEDGLRLYSQIPIGPIGKDFIVPYLNLFATNVASLIDPNGIDLSYSASTGDKDVRDAFNNLLCIVLSSPCVSYLTVIDKNADKHHHCRKSKLRLNFNYIFVLLQMIFLLLLKRKLN